MSGQFSWSWLSMLMKNRGVGGTLKKTHCVDCILAHIVSLSKYIGLAFKTDSLLSTPTFGPNDGHMSGALMRNMTKIPVLKLRQSIN